MARSTRFRIYCGTQEIYSTSTSTPGFSFHGIVQQIIVFFSAYRYHLHLIQLTASPFPTTFHVLSHFLGRNSAVDNFGFSHNPSRLR